MRVWALGVGGILILQPLPQEPTPHPHSSSPSHSSAWKPSLSQAGGLAQPPPLALLQPHFSPPSSYLTPSPPPPCEPEAYEGGDTVHWSPSPQPQRPGHSCHQALFVPHSLPSLSHIPRPRPPCPPFTPLRSPRNYTKDLLDSLACPPSLPSTPHGEPAFLDAPRPRSGPTPFPLMLGVLGPSHSPGFAWGAPTLLVSHQQLLNLPQSPHPWASPSQCLKGRNHPAVSENLPLFLGPTPTPLLKPQTEPWDLPEPPSPSSLL